MANTAIYILLTALILVYLFGYQENILYFQKSVYTRILRGRIHTQIATRNVNLTYVGGWV